MGDKGEFVDVFVRLGGVVIEQLIELEPWGQTRD